MARLAIAAAGAAIGGLVGGPWGARAGWVAGSLIGGMVAGGKTKNEGPRLDDLKLMAADEGADLPRVFGSMRIAGTCIWTSDIQEITSVETESAKGGPKTETTTYSYTVSMAVALCEGEITGVRRIWADTSLIYSAADDVDVNDAYASGILVRDGIRIYTGTETQTADPTYQAGVGAANASAFRGVAYLVITDLDLSPYNGRRPNITAEVVVGTAQDPPTRIADFEPSQDALSKDFSHAEIMDGVLALQVIDPYSSAYMTWTNEYYDLHGNKLGEETRQVPNPHGSTNVDIYYCSGNASIAFIRRNGAGDGYGVGRWLYKGREHGQPLPVAGLLNYYYVITSTMLYHASRVYTLCGAAGSSIGAVARYPVINGIPMTIPDAYYNFEALISATGTIDIGAISVGDDGLIYVSISGNIDDGTHHVLIFDADLNYIDYIDWAGGATAGRYALWVSADGTRLGKLATNKIEHYDISDRQNPVLLNDATDAAFSNVVWQAMAIPGGLFVTRIGVWAFSDVIQNTGATLKSIVDELCIEAGLVSGDLDTTALSAITVPGYVRPRRMSARAALEPLRQAYFFDLIASDDKLKAVVRGGAAAVTITADDCVAVDGADNYPIEHSITDDLSLPADVSVQFFAKDNDYQPGARRAQRYTGQTTESDTAIDVSLPIALSSAYGAQVADILLRTAWAESEAFRFSLPAKYLYLEPGDCLNVTLSTGTHRARIVRFDVGTSYTAEIEAVADYASYTSSAPDYTDYTESSIPLYGPTFHELIDIAQLRTEDDSPGYYVAMTGMFPDWQGAALYTSPDDLTWATVGTVTQAAKMGMATTALSVSADVGLGYDTWSAVTVDLYDDSLSLASVTEAEFLNGGSVALIGEEIVAFRDVVDNGDGTYTLRTFIRGLCGTQDRMTGHAAYERFVLISGAGVLAITGELSDTGVTKYLKPVSLRGSFQSARSEAETLANARIIPYAPAQAAAHKWTSGAAPGYHWRIEWLRSARKDYELYDGVDTPLDETTEAYEIDILDGVGGSVVRTITASTTTADYTGAQQITDFGYTTPLLNANIYQLSDRMGRGHVATIVDAPAIEWATSIDAQYQFAGILLGWHAGTGGTQSDIGTQGATLTWAGTPTTATDLPYIYSYSSAFRSKVFSTSSHYASAANDVDWTWQYEITIACWIKSSMTPGTTYVVPFISKWDTTVDASKGWRLGFQNVTTGSIRFAWRSTGGTDFAVVTTTTGWNDGAWHFVVGVHKAGETHIYIDGVDQGITGTGETSTAAINSTTTAVYIGRHSNVLAGDNFVGSIAFAGVWNYAISEAQQARLYDRARSGGILA